MAGTNVDAQSNDPNIPAVSGKNTAAGLGVFGESAGFEGVRGVNHAPGHGGVVGISENHIPQAGPGVFGQSDAPGVWGASKTWHGVVGQSESTTPHITCSKYACTATGIIGESKVWHAIFGKSESTTGGVGVWGEHPGTGTGVVGHSDSGRGVFGESANGDGVFGHGPGNGRGVVGVSDNHTGVEGNSTNGVGVWGQSSNGDAGHFEGNVTVTGDIKLTGGDCAEEFDISEAADVEPGTVMVLDQEGALQPSQRAYDKRVAGVISGAGHYKPGIVLDRQQSSENRMPVALVGKVYCKVDAQYGPIEVGDLLTTSDTLGYAMKADDPLKAFGSVIGKALRPLKAGQGLIPIMVALQ